MNDVDIELTQILMPISINTNYQVKTVWYLRDYQQWLHDGCHVNYIVKTLFLYYLKSEFEVQIENLSESIGNLVNLEYINCEFNNLLSHLPESIGNLTKLRYLLCKYNKLTYLPKSIGKLSHLNMLDLSYNELKYLPVSIGNLINLQHLDVSNNELIILPSTITKLINLEKLFCNSNKLINIPQYIGKLVNLRVLELKKNKLKYLPLSIKYLINLNLDIDFNYEFNNDVHSNMIQTRLLDSLDNLLSGFTEDNLLSGFTNKTAEQNIQEIMIDSILDIKTKILLLNSIEDKTVYTNILINFKELLIYIFAKIEN